MLPSIDMRGAREPLSIEDRFAARAELAGLPPFVREHQFAYEWRLSFAWPHYSVALHIERTYRNQLYCGEGIVYGRYCTPFGYRDTMLKLAAAAVRGWHVVTFNQEYILNGTAVDTIRSMLTLRGWSYERAT